MQRTFRNALAATLALAFVLATGTAALGYGGKAVTCMVNGNLVASGRYWEPGATVNITSSVTVTTSATVDSKGTFSKQLTSVSPNGPPPGTYTATFTSGSVTCTATFRVTKPRATSFTLKGGPTVTVGMLLLLVLLGGAVFFVPRAIVRRRAGV